MKKKSLFTNYLFPITVNVSNCQENKIYLSQSTNCAGKDDVFYNSNFLKEEKAFIDDITKVRNSYYNSKSSNSTDICKYEIIEEFVCYALKFAYVLSKQTDLSSIQDNLARNPKVREFLSQRTAFP